ncbi:hypothetical protein [Parapedobacter sp. 10938]|uniref:hypothetical protein n=1 Tax=Parapedobacter flavus TaxID=3110225 RepID=UPI002DBF8B15|nr:hypothetical protein [Parapedobacter sp. 10938]MEC3881878.1 hypothetical protein [Parapedobacter sp. 10938]
MTFEEFFTKKRIDLALLRRAKPDLYEEFRDHYAQMSEKSFDHTKKYWFNRLRKDFLLEVVEPPKAVTEREPISKAAEVPTSTAQAAKPAGFKPRFKPGTTSAPKPVDKPTEVPPEPTGAGETSAAPDEKPATPTTKPVGFKPRFKPGATAMKKKVEQEEHPEPDSSAPTPEPAAASKPSGFKPRFKAGTTPVKKVEREGAGKTTNKKDDTDTT